MTTEEQKKLDAAKAAETKTGGTAGSAGGVVGAGAEDKSQPLKAAGNSAEAAVAGAASTNTTAQERPATPAGPKASDIPATSIVGADGEQLLSADGAGPGPVVSSTNEYTVSQADLIRLMGVHLGFDPNVGVTEVKAHPNGIEAGFIVKYSR